MTERGGRSAPQNDREKGKAAPQNDRRGERGAEGQREGKRRENGGEGRKPAGFRPERTNKEMRALCRIRQSAMIGSL